MDADTLHIHHKRPVAAGGTNDHGNLEVLCAPCHRLLHRHHGIDRRIMFQAQRRVEFLEEALLPVAMIEDYLPDML